MLASKTPWDSEVHGMDNYEVKGQFQFDALKVGADSL